VLAGGSADYSVGRTPNGARTRWPPTLSRSSALP